MAGANGMTGRERVLVSLAILCLATQVALGVAIFVSLQGLRSDLLMAGESIARVSRSTETRVKLKARGNDPASDEHGPDQSSARESPGIPDQQGAAVAAPCSQGGDDLVWEPELLFPELKKASLSRLRAEYSNFPRARGSLEYTVELLETPLTEWLHRIADDEMATARTEASRRVIALWSPKGGVRSEARVTELTLLAESVLEAYVVLKQQSVAVRVFEEMDLETGDPEGALRWGGIAGELDERAGTLLDTLRSEVGRVGEPRPGGGR